MHLSYPPRSAYVAEAIGTFALVFAGTGAIIVDGISSGSLISHTGVALTFGLVVMAVVYSIGDVSGAHINPAVTIGFWASGRFKRKHVLPYIGSQVTGALVASALLYLMFPSATNLGMTMPSGSVEQSFVMEVILTFLLMFVILCVAIGAKEKGVAAGMSIGGTVALEALFAGPVSGASMNPARSIGPAAVGINLTDQWIYVVAPVVGAILAVYAYRVVYADAEPAWFGRNAVEPASTDKRVAEQS